jgi:hypothetical protein
MSKLTRFERWYGRDEPPPEHHEVRAGPLAMIVDGGDLRYVRLGHTELVRRLFAAVRDRNWNTITGTISGLRLETDTDSFRLSFSSHHVSDDIDFEWQATVAGSAGGTIRYELDGGARRAFRYCRIGLCVLHPVAEFAGRPYAARTASQDHLSGALPELIGPQRVENGFEVPLFPSFDALTVDLRGGIEVVHEFEGDLFETEDQRNWTDASFKTYSTPLALGYPHDASAGQRFRQMVTVRVHVPPVCSEPKRSRSVSVTLGEQLSRSLPLLGVGLNPEVQPLSPRATALLGELNLDHLRVDVDPAGPAYAGLLERAAAEASALGCELELALFLSDKAEDELEAVAAALQPDVPIARILLYHVREPVTPISLADLARQHLRTARGFAGGTNAYFAQLNAFRPGAGAFDAIAYPITPQVHAFDEASLVETLAAQGETVVTARSFADGAAIVVSPVTLRPRFNPDAKEPEQPPGPGELPPAVDPRQMSLFGAAWTLGSIKHLAESGVAAATYYETVGWRGLVETEAGPSVRALFPSHPGMVFPLYHVFADLAGWRCADVVACRSSDSLAVEGLALRRADDELLLVANLSPRPLAVAMQSLRASRTAWLRVLDEDTFGEATLDPAAFRVRGKRVAVRSDELTVELAPYAIASLEFRLTG